ncbi:MAG: EAL domain-containing protein [Betaproteobacteria bacterium]|nr:EAL domain-containing protein [Betaproteobacteria bacterium]
MPPCHEQLQTLIDAMPDAVCLKDIEGRWQFINQTARQMFRLHDMSWQGKTEEDLTALQPAFCTGHEACGVSDEAAWQAGRPLAGEESFAGEDDRHITVETRKVPMYDQMGQRNLLMVIWRDITERKQHETELHLIASVFTHAREGIIITAVDNTIIEINDAFSRITGYARDEVLGKNPRIVSSGRQGKAFYAAMWRELNDKGYWSGEIQNRRKNGEVYDERLAISAVCDGQGNIEHYVGMFSDISALKAYERQIERITYYDTLTNLPNRVRLAERLQQSMVQARQQGQQLAVICIDLDDFKVVNTKHGHEIGDQLLMTIATRMKQALRENDMLARMGGDEFVAVLGDLDNIEASVPMRIRLLSATAQAVQVGGITIQVSASIGVTFYPQEEDVEADQLLRQADRAMYQAKLTGKNRSYVFDAKQDREIHGHHESLERIRCALTEREFVLHYQPKVNMRTGSVVGAEALIRWQHPEKGLLLPATFLPVIENHPLFVEMGEWVIDTALTQMETWHAAGLDIPVSVNVGACQLREQNFVERLHTLLAAHPDIGPGKLELELLETSALEDMPRVSHIIERCREIGVLFSLDDFGTGYSSLSYLKHLRVALLKIDQSFVRDMLGDPDDLAILDGVIGLAAAFRCKVIAEGVETVEHGEMLLQLGCELAQGYGIARPMPAHEFPDWAAIWRPDPVWADRPVVSREHLPLLFAGVEHRAWIAGIENFLGGGSEMPPLDPHQCRLGAWMNEEGVRYYGTQPDFQVIEQLHRQLHALALELLELHAGDRNSEALARLNELHDLRDDLFEKLQKVVSQRAIFAIEPHIFSRNNF